jgi:hypothetical protein
MRSSGISGFERPGRVDASATRARALRGRLAGQIAVVQDRGGAILITLGITGWIEFTRWLGFVLGAMWASRCSSRSRANHVD